MSALIQALHRAELARRRHRQVQQTVSTSTQPTTAAPISPTPTTDADPDLPLLHLADAVRLGHRD